MVHRVATGATPTDAVAMPGPLSRRQLLIPLEQQLQPLLVGRERLLAIEPVDGAVERPVRLRQLRRHRERVVEIGEGAVRIALAGIKNCLREPLDLGLLCIGDVARPGKVVVDDVLGVAVVALEATADRANLVHVHC